MYIDQPLAYEQIITLGWLYQASFSGRNVGIYSSEVKESHLNGDLRYQHIFWSFLPRLIDIVITNIPKGEKNGKLFILNLIDQRCLCLPHFYWLSAKTLWEIIYNVKRQYQHKCFPYPGHFKCAYPCGVLPLKLERSASAVAKYSGKWKCRIGRTLQCSSVFNSNLHDSIAPFTWKLNLFLFYFIF